MVLMLLISNGYSTGVLIRTERLLPDPYVAAVDVIGDAWTFLITREALFGARRFGDFCSALRVSRARLTERLNHLVAAGIFEKRLYNAAPPRYEYRLTDKGRGLYPIALTLIAWGAKWGKAGAQTRLVHEPCECGVEPKVVCRSCRLGVRHSDIRWLPIIPLSKVAPGMTSVKGWQKSASLAGISDRPDPAIEAVKAVGDRWSMLIMYGAQQTEFRFREAQASLGLAHNVLSVRLRSLIEAGLLKRTNASRRALYVATESGLDFVDTIFAARTWAMDYPPAGISEWASVRHKPCGADLQVTCVCKHCNRTLDPRDVTYSETALVGAKNPVPQRSRRSK